MGRSWVLGSIFIASVLFIGCATQQKEDSESVAIKAEFVRHASQASPSSKHDPAAGQQLVSKAKSALGTPYVLGGSAPGGFDCSGLVKWAYNSIGVTLPRTAREQSVVGEKIGNVEDMRAGDIVAFRHPKRGYHTGIYVGDGKFIHSPRKRTRVRINSLSDPYFRETFLSARRVNTAQGENLVAQASERLEKYISERTTLSIARNIKARKAQKTHDLLAANSKKAAKSVATRGHKPVAKNKNVVAKKSAKTVASNKKSAKASVKANPKAKNQQLAKNQKNSRVAANSKALTKKQASRTVSMLQKKTAKPVSRRKHS